MRVFRREWRGLVPSFVPFEEKPQFFLAQTAFDKAVNVWNTYKPGVIRPDSIWNIEDITISDVNSSAYQWAGLTLVNSVGFGTIQFNKHQLSSCNEYQIQNTAIHELGHALGLDHSKHGNCLYEHVTEITTLGYTDKITYDYVIANN